jgi:hypothetical protein
MPSSILAECVRKALSEEQVGWDPAAPVEYAYDGNLIPETQVFATNTWKGN